MNILFVHTNFPGQFGALAQVLAGDGSHRVAAIGSQTARPVPGVRLQRYHFDDVGHAGVHTFARRFDREARRAEQVLYALIALEADGFRPDVIIAHSGWGETLPLKAKCPQARLIVYCEFYYRETGQDVHFDPEFPRLGVDGLTSLRAKNANQLLALIDCDMGLSPTAWQRSTYPPEFQHKIAVIHEGVDAERVRPDHQARFALSNGRVLTRDSQVISFVSRNLEPMRGYHIFMRALPEILQACPGAEVVVVGGDDVSYGDRSPDGRSWKDVFRSEVARSIDPSRVHFVGKLAYQAYLELLQISAAHVYLTYPFVLSWSLVEAMSAGCLVIASDTAPLREVVRHGENGLLVPFFDRRQLSRAVIDALQRPEVYRQLREAARRTAVSAFDRRAVTERLLALVLGQRTPERQGA
ncbi:glycosyltransferase [Methylobacterium haplocladii]|uniref:Glycosyl transferase n=1 Tax=Methylobacterium haplocladii TaxID=1176176 RepID=A0A512IVP2_9HYPH|nr:glycosyltransferase [Methylobacterium haplocladii]GEP01787.1 glycosyl transferase [Methylobacterium haplocladii]GJD86281.1 D-inositol-3-phosphate glycosyltransferase [Methylobacterium haplocladii]GLS60458.1 glycosyl transferase [Methylobacterium haplocladii]